MPATARASIETRLPGADRSALVVAVGGTAVGLE